MGIKNRCPNTKQQFCTNYATTIKLSIENTSKHLDTLHLANFAFRGLRVVSDRENESPKGRLNNSDQSSNCLGPAECAKRLNKCWRGPWGGVLTRGDGYTRIYLIASRIPPGRGNYSINRSCLVDLSVTRFQVTRESMSSKRKIRKV